MKTKFERLKTINGMLKNLKARKVDARQEIRTLDSAITFYETMKEQVKKE